MTDLATAPAAEAPIAAPPVVEREWTPSDAARLLASRRNRPEQAAAPEAAPPAQELAHEANAAPAVEQPSSEAPEVAEPAAQPLIEPPRSWTQAEKERFQSLPRETQEYLHTREQERDREIRRSQNEAAETRKAAEAERKQAEEIRKQYEAKLPQVMQMIQEVGPFADIRSMADVEKLQKEDPFRFQEYQLFQWKLQATEAERKQAEERQQSERANARAAYAREQDAKLVDLIPEMKDPAKASTIRTNAVKMLVDDYGFSEGDLGAIMQTEDGFRLLSDARWQKLIADGLKYHESLKAKATIAAKPLPPVQRPGVSAPAQNSNAGRIQALSKQLETASGVNQAKIMAEIRQLRRAG